MKFEKLDREAVERELAEFIGRFEMKVGRKKLTVEWVKNFTYNFDLPAHEITGKYFGTLVNTLPKNACEQDFEEAVRIFNDVWNCFPQKIMGGKSPQDTILEEIEKENTNLLISPLSEEILDEHSEYMEKSFIEYIQWAYKEVLPKYDIHIAKLSMSKKKKNEYAGVAGVFLEICGQAGMFELMDVPSEFVVKFPDLFTEMVVGPKIPKEEIAKQLKTFLSFLDNFYGIQMLGAPQL